MAKNVSALLMFNIDHALRQYETQQGCREGSLQRFQETPCKTWTSKLFSLATVSS